MVRENVAIVEVVVEDAEARRKFRWKSAVVNPDGRSIKRKKSKSILVVRPGIVRFSQNYANVLRHPPPPCCVCCVDYIFT